MYLQCIYYIYVIYIWYLGSFSSAEHLRVTLPAVAPAFVWLLGQHGQHEHREP